jgi:catechol-2,3-dioxygenase
MTPIISGPLVPGPLRHVELCTTTDLDEVTKFYLAWGLEVIERSEDAVALRASGTDHHVLRFMRSDHVGLSHIAFAAPSRHAVDNLHQAWAGRGVEIADEPAMLTSLGGGYGFEAADPEGRRLRVITEMDASDPLDRSPSLPRRLSHVVLNTADIDLLCEFYVSMLGFRVSDWSEHQMVFLRNLTDHHTIAFNQEGHASVNHIAHEVDSLDGFLTAVGRMRSAGVDPLWGIGRHGPGNNAFAYYGDPAGFVPEFTTDLEQVEHDASWVPRVWKRIPSQSDLWHLAGPPSSEFRRYGAGQPDPGLHSPRWDRS